MDDDYKIVVKNLSFFYRNVQALRNLSLGIRANEILAIFGPARSGKSTFLRTLNRLNDLIHGARMEGEVRMDGRSTYAPDVDPAELRRRVGMVFDLPVPLPLSVFDNVAYGPRMAGLNHKGRLEGLVEEALKAAALWEEAKDRLASPATRLSGGQQQRLCIARVLALRPEVVLLDEPTSGLDPISTAKIEDSMRDLKARYTIVLVPHSVEQAARVADSAAFFLMGELVEHGPAETIFTRPRDRRTEDYVTGRFG